MPNESDETNFRVHGYLDSASMLLTVYCPCSVADIPREENTTQPMDMWGVRLSLCIT